MWYISALFKSGRADEAYEIMNMINPARINDGDGALRYLGEPYVLAADVSLEGRAGWSWYTGSAGLFYRVILEDMLGVTLKNNRLIIKPNLPKAINSCRIEYRYKQSVYAIEIERGEEKAFIVNGMNIKNNNGIALRDGEKLKIRVITDGK
jgi:cellobiose phosphorylase